ncbi:cytidine deaminase [Sinorhizobium sp. 7-81]|uniref:cytidine deaminase n=1 Tax=Sinorhizobium sp. 8-89 TaxID=3049089 RepID=UPI0024C2308A|nr:cytidine deaminase [Sinorhizobium sp. 8-89]MDK1494080.1 cytidine deaminase [Sinorhizobium sp. 8-89]
MVSADAFDAGWVDAATARALAKESKLSEGLFLRSLIERAKKLSRSTMSNYRVGAVVLGGSGAIYLGANIELPGSELCQTIHAEQSVVINALSHGETRLAALAISAAPCGSCRQFLNELADADRLAIWLARDTPYSLVDLLPKSFGPQDLGVTGGLLAPQDNGLVTQGRPDAAGQAALDAANRSYAPYTKSFAGCVFVLDDGTLWPGPYVENAAFNPSLSPGQTALVGLTMAGRDWRTIREVVLVETSDSPVDHRRALDQLLGSLGLGITPATILVTAKVGEA